MGKWINEKTVVDMVCAGLLSVAAFYVISALTGCTAPPMRVASDYPEKIVVKLSGAHVTSLEAKVDALAVAVMRLEAMVSQTKTDASVYVKDREESLAYTACTDACNKKYPMRTWHQATDWDEEKNTRVLKAGYRTPAWQRWFDESEDCSARCDEHKPVNHLGC